MTQHCDKDNLAVDRFVDVDGIATHYKEYGCGPATLLVMHGWGCSAQTLESVSRCAARTMHVLSIDFPGFGQTPEPPFIWGVEEYTRFIECFLEKMGVKNPVLLGHSFGGRVGILYASRHRDTAKLILVDSAGIKPRRNLRYYLKVYWFKTLKKIAGTVLPKDKALSLIENARKKNSSADYSAASPVMRGILSKVVNQDLTHVLHLIKAPTLLIWGKEDTATPLRDAYIIKKHVKDVGLVTFDGCGHYSFLDNPAGFAAVLTSFLKS